MTGVTVQGILEALLDVFREEEEEPGYYDEVVAGVLNGRVVLFQNHGIPGGNEMDLFQFHWDTYNKKYLMFPYNPSQVMN